MPELGTKTARMGSVDQRPAQRDTNWGNKMLTKCLEEKIYERAKEKNETRGKGRRRLKGTLQQGKRRQSRTSIDQYRQEGLHKCF